MAKRGRRTHHAVSSDSAKTPIHKPGRLAKPSYATPPQGTGNERYAAAAKRVEKPLEDGFAPHEEQGYLPPQDMAQPQTLPAVQEPSQTALAVTDLNPMYEAIAEMQARIDEAEQNRERSVQAQQILKREMDTATQLAEEADSELVAAAKKAAYLKHEAKQVCTEGLVLQQQLNEEEQYWQNRLEEEQLLLTDAEQKLRIAEEESQRVNHAKEVAARMNEREMWRLGSSKQGLWLQRRKVQGNALQMARDKSGSWQMPKVVSSPGATYAQTMLEREQKLQEDYDPLEKERLNMLSESAQALAERQSSQLEESFLEQLAAREAARHLAAQAELLADEQAAAMPPQAALRRIETPLVGRDAPGAPSMAAPGVPLTESPDPIASRAEPTTTATAAPLLSADVLTALRRIEKPLRDAPGAPLTQSPDPIAPRAEPAAPLLNADVLAALRRIETPLVGRDAPGAPLTESPDLIAPPAEPAATAAPLLTADLLAALRRIETPPVGRGAPGAPSMAGSIAPPTEPPVSAHILPPSKAEEQLPYTPEAEEAALAAARELPEGLDPLQFLAMRAASHAASSQSVPSAAPEPLLVQGSALHLETAGEKPVVIPINEEDIQRLARQANLLAQQHLTQQQPPEQQAEQFAGRAKIAQKVADETGRQDHLLKEQQTAEMAIAAAMAAARKAAQSAMAISEQVNQQMPALNSRGLAEEDRPYSVERIIADALSKAAVADQSRR